MRIRSIKPEFWRSPDVSCLSIEDRLLFIGLWSYVDDNGVGEDRVSMIAADLFADDLEDDPHDTFARVSRGLQNLSERGRIMRYTVSGRSFLEIVNWSKHQRIDKPAKPRYPQYSAENGTLATPSRDPRDTLAPGTGEQGTEEQGNREQGNPPSGEDDTPEPIDRFDEFYTAWPKKVDKPAARRAWVKAIKRADPDTIITAAVAYRDHPHIPPRQFIRNPATWLNGDGWNDELPPPRGGDKPTPTQRALQTVAAGASAAQRRTLGNITTLRPKEIS